MDRTKQLETVKCNWVLWYLCRQLAGSTMTSRECTAAFPCDHKALTPAEKVPVCPVCGRVLEALGAEGFLCSNFECAYEQPDSAQRPKMPAPREGYHAGECVKPMEGTHEAWFNWSGEFIHTWESSKPAQDKFSGFRWIAVKDAPVREPVVNHHTKECAFWSDCHNGFDHPRECDCGADKREEAAKQPVVRCPECVQFDCTDRGKTMPKEECGGRDFQASPVKVPVVEYWRYVYVNSGGMKCKTVDGVIVEGVDRWIGQELAPRAWTQITEQEYESARKPAKPAIEPLSESKHKEAIAWLNGERSLSNVVPQDPYETWQERIARADAAMTEQAYWMVRAYNEQKRVNALEGGGRK